MKDFNSRTDTLYIPLLSKVYTSEHFPEILYDEKVLQIKDKLPHDIPIASRMVQYTYVSGAIRSRKIDDKIDDFLYLNKNGVVVQLGIRLSTACYRSKSKNPWYGLDTESNFELRNTLFGVKDNVYYVKTDIFDTTWLTRIMSEHPGSPILIMAAGVFNYYEKEKVMALLEEFYRYENIEIIFDAVSQNGQRRMKKFYKQMGLNNYKSLFYLNGVKDLHLAEANGTVLDEDPFFENIKKRRFHVGTRIYMRLADLFNMINVYHISTNRNY